MPTNLPQILFLKAYICGSNNCNIINHCPARTARTHPIRKSEFQKISPLLKLIRYATLALRLSVLQCELCLLLNINIESI